MKNGMLLTQNIKNESPSPRTLKGVRGKLQTFCSFLDFFGF